MRIVRRNCQATDGGDAKRWLSYSELQAINDAYGFQPLSDSVSKRIQMGVEAEFADGRIDRKACVVTDAWVFRRDAACVPVDELPLQAMRKVLCPKDWTTQAIDDYYDCSALDARLSGMLLSVRGFERDSGVLKAWIAQDALRHLQKLNARILAEGDECVNATPPRFAIADCFVAGAFAEINKASQLERQTVGLAQTRGLVKVIYGGPGNVLQSHLVCWDNRHATIASSVPSVPRRETFQIVLAGPLTSRQEALLAKHHECDGAKVMRMHELLKRINPLYDNVEENSAFNEADSAGDVYCTRLPSTTATDDLVSQARARQLSVAVPQAAATAGDSDEREGTIVESETILIETVLDHDEQARLARAYRSVTSSKSTYLTRRSTTILQQNDAAYVERLFPHLFTFGIGGFSSQRERRYSKRDIVLHYLNLSTNRFAEDSMFKLQMFDFLSTLRVKNGIFVRVRQDPDVATQASQITPEQLQAAMEERKQRRRAAQSGHPRATNMRPTRASRVVKSMRASSAKMWGSNEEREAFQRKVKAMTRMYGEPSVFWTLTPNPDASIAVAFWTDHKLPHGRPKDLEVCTDVNMPCSSEMAKLVMQNTVVQAHYYRMCCRLLVDVLFGWDSATDKPKREPGIFGFLEALFYALEQQGRLRVHHHGVAWVAGMPKTRGDWDHLLGSDELRLRYEAYCASIFAAELPVFKELAALSCPNEGCSGSLQELAIPAKYKHLLKPGTAAPKVAICAVCRGEFTDAEVIASVVDSKWAALDAGGQAASSPDSIRAMRMRFGGLSDDPGVADVQLTRLLLQDQIHAFEHTRSCVKGRHGTKCRYKFPRPLELTTGLSEKYEVVYKRWIGNQWLNSYIPLWRRLLHFNMDARMLWSGTSMQAIHYAMQYAAKRQSVLDNVSVVEMALKRRIQREAVVAADKSPYQKGLSRLMALAYSSSGVMEVGGPLATAILMDGEAAKFSCRFERLVVLEALNIMDDVDVEVTIVSRGGELFTETSIRKYVNRPLCLEDWGWYDFTAWFKSSEGKQVDSRTPCGFADNGQGDLALHVKSHGLVKVEYPHVPEIIGPSLPDARRLDDPEYVEQAELYYRMALLLHCPFRNPKEFLDQTGSAVERFRAWNPSSNLKLQRALDFHQQCYLCFDEANAYRAELDADEEDEICLDDDVQDRSIHQHDSVVGSCRSLVVVPPDMYDGDGDLQQAEDREHIDSQTPGDAAAIHERLDNFISRAVLPDDEVECLTVRATPFRREDLQQAGGQAGQMAALGEETLQGQTELESSTTRISVEHLEDATRHLQFDATEQAPAEVCAFATVSDVSRFFGLNEQQHAAFVLIALPLLYKIVDAPLPDREEGACVDGSPLIVTGAGGTGKSRIIDAVRSLAQSWRRPDCVLVTASTGIAAASLGGVTLHNSVGLGINQSRLPKHLDRPSDKLLQTWDPVLCVIADEMSMVDIGLLGLWEEAICRLKETPLNGSAPFGGLVTVLMFDHCQLSAVRGTPVYKTSSTMQKPFSAIQERGCRIYQAIMNVVYLEDNMRFADDPEWGNWLAEARLGRWTPAMRAFLEQVETPHADLLDNELVQIVSTDNASRKLVNDAATQAAARLLPAGRKVYAIPAQISGDHTSAELTKIRAMTDTQTGNIPLFLLAYIGAIAVPCPSSSNLSNVCSVFVRRHASPDQGQPMCPERRGQWSVRRATAHRLASRHGFQAMRQRCLGRE